MTCCLTAPSHYLNQCWLIISKVLWHESALSWEDLKIPISKTRLKIPFLELHLDLPGANELKSLCMIFQVGTTIHWWVGLVGLDLFNDDTCPSGHISRPVRLCGWYIPQFSILSHKVVDLVVVTILNFKHFILEVLFIGHQLHFLCKNKIKTIFLIILNQSFPYVQLILNIIEPSHKSQNASVPYPTMQHFLTEMCPCVYISVTKCCIVGYLSDALWDLWDWSIEDMAYNMMVIKVEHRLLS